MKPFQMRVMFTGLSEFLIIFVVPSKAPVRQFHSSWRFRRMCCFMGVSSLLILIIMSILLFGRVMFTDAREWYYEIRCFSFRCFHWHRSGGIDSRYHRYLDVLYILSFRLFLTQPTHRYQNSKLKLCITPGIKIWSSKYTKISEFCSQTHPGACSMLKPTG